MKNGQTVSKNAFYIVIGLLAAAVCILLVFMVLLKRDVTAYEHTSSIIGTYESENSVPNSTQYLVFEKHKNGLKAVWYQAGEFQYDGQVTTLKKGIHQIHFDDPDREMFVYVDRKGHINLVERDFVGSFDKIANHSVYMGIQQTDAN